jgi:hypothetical protein
MKRTGERSVFWVHRDGALVGARVLIPAKGLSSRKVNDRVLIMNQYN